MTASDWIALGVGSYAAVVASAALIWNILRERHNVIVKVMYAFGMGILGGEEMVAVEIINNGRRPINIKEIGFFLSNGMRLINPYAQQNLGWLKDGDGTSYFVPRQEIDKVREQAKEQNAIIVAAYVRDSTNTYYKGKIRKDAKWLSE